MLRFLRDLQRETSLPQIGNEPIRVLTLVGAWRQLLRRSKEMAVDHVQRGLAFGRPVSLGQLALHDQVVTVVHERTFDEAQHLPGRAN